MKTSSLAALTIVALTLASASHAGGTYIDAKSGASALVPDGFQGTHLRGPEVDLLMTSETHGAFISVVARPLSTTEFKQVVAALETEGSGDVLSSIYTFDDHLVGFVPLAGGRMVVMSSRPQGVALGNFPGTAITDAHAGLVDAVARSVKVQRVATVSFDVPHGFKEMNVEGAKALFDEANGRFVFVADDETDDAKPLAQQAYDVVMSGLLGKKNLKFTIDGDSVRSPREGIGAVNVTLVSSGVPMAGVIARVGLPGRPVWVVAVGKGEDPAAQQALLDGVIASMLRKTVVASR